MPLNNPPVVIQNAGVTQGAVNTVNFTGSVTAAVTGNVATIHVTGGSGSFSITQIEIDFGATPTLSKTFTVTDGNVSTNSNIIATQSGAAATGRSADENAMDPIIFSANPGSGQFLLYANSLNGPIIGKYRVNYTVG